MLFWNKKYDAGQYTVVFKDDSMSNYKDKMTYAKSNRDYWILESQFMTKYSYPTDVVFVGDSITYRCQWNEIFLGLNVKNRGIPSDTTGGVYARIDSIIKTQPQKVFVMIGINDIVQNIEEEEIFDNYCNILDTLSDVPDVEIYVESILPVAESTGISKVKIMEINRQVEGMCHEKGIMYIDLYNIFVDDNGWLAEQYSADGVHINANGYECWKNKIEEYVY